MAEKPWSTKEEVLKDLAKAYGRRRTSLDDLDEGYLVVGDAPPPVRSENIDFEMQLLFGDATSSFSAVPPEEDNKPDLEGITRMLRMVQEFESREDDEHMSDDDANKEYVIAISKVSKLNPNVEEFKPKGLISHSTELVNKYINTNVLKQTVKPIEEAKKALEVELKGKESSDSNDKKTVEVTEKNKKKPEGKGSGDNDDLKVYKFEDVTTTLKNQISDAAKSDSFEFKKHKNVAIATLLKLYAKNSTSPPKCTAPVKLMTPEYFEGKVESRTEVRVETPVHVATTESSSTPEPRDSSTTLPSCATLSTSTSSANLTSPRVKVDPEVKKSIDKVNRWLEEPPKPTKSPAVYLGPISFKRKDPASSISPGSATSSPSRKPAPQEKQYKPSKYAADLGQKYLERSRILESKQREDLERSKMLESKPKEVTWSNLEEVLKAKDLEIKKRQEEQPSTSGS